MDLKMSKYQIKTYNEKINKTLIAYSNKCNQSLFTYLEKFIDVYSQYRGFYLY